MEQVLRTVSALNDAGFTEITMYETLLRPHEVNQVPVLQTVEDISEKLKKAEQKRETKRLKQIASSQQSKRKREEDVGDELAEVDGNAVSVKRVKTDDEAVLQNRLPQEIPEILVTSSTDSDPKICVSKAIPEVRGHTSYLTFACLLPGVAPAAPAGSPVPCGITNE